MAKNLTKESKINQRILSSDSLSPGVGIKKLATSLGDEVVGSCKVNLLPEYGVIHLSGALSEAGQKNLWNLTKPVVEDPKGKGAGFSSFNFHKKRSTAPRKYPDIDQYGYLLFQLAAKGLMAQSDSSVDLVNEPSYKHLAEISSDKVPVQLDDTWMLYYRADARFNNHIDSDSVLFTMSVALGDDCEFIIGKKTGRARYGERCHHGVRTIKMRSGDAIFFDGGSVPHCVNRLIEGSAPSWWEKAKVPNGSRCVLLFREKETSRNGRYCPANTKKKKKKSK